MQKKKGFTLVELLAVIVILAVILVIAVPQIMSVIESARKGSIESTAKLIAEGAEREYTNRKILGKDTNIECSDVSSMNSNDYGTCVITFDNTGKATVKVTGKGKFEGYTCNGNSTNMECVKGEISEPTETAAQYFSYSDVNDGTEVVKTVDVTVKDKNKCVAYLPTIGATEEQANILCSGNALVNGYTLKDVVKEGGIPSSDYETAGIEVNWIIINNVTVKDKDKCVAYLPTIGATEEQANILCSGNALVNGTTLKDVVQEGGIPSSNYETAGLEVTTVEEEIIITGYNIEGGTDVVIPSEINGKKVIGIANYAFTDRGVTPTNISNTKKASISYLYNNRNVGTVRKLDISAYGLGITSVVIPDTVIGIGQYAFYGNQLTNVTIPNTVTRIGSEAFVGNQLIEVTIPGSVKTIDRGAFASNKLTSLTISNGVESINGGAFANNQLTNVTIPNSVTSIGDRAFAGNRGITITNNSIIENSSDVWNEIVSGATACGNFYVDSITDNVIKISQNTGPC